MPNPQYYEDPYPLFQSCISFLKYSSFTSCLGRREPKEYIAPDKRTILLIQDKNDRQLVTAGNSGTVNYTSGSGFNVKGTVECKEQLSVKGTVECKKEQLSANVTHQNMAQH